MSWVQSNDADADGVAPRACEMRGSAMRNPVVFATKSPPMDRRPPDSDCSKGPSPANWSWSEDRTDDTTSSTSTFRSQAPFAPPVATACTTPEFSSKPPANGRRTACAWFESSALTSSRSNWVPERITDPVRSALPSASPGNRTSRLRNSPPNRSAVSSLVILPAASMLAAAVTTRMDRRVVPVSSRRTSILAEPTPAKARFATSSPT